jgi:osomolarity two-component system, response regulator SSK1
MDIQMPVMDGIQATKEIRRMEKANAKAGYPPLTPSTDGHTPSDTSSADSATSSVTSTDTRASNSPYRSSVIIVALTASSLQSDRVAALAAGCNDFLTKPVSLLWLNNKIIEWGSIKALQMWADIRPDALTSGQAAQARNIADRLHVPPKGRKTPSPTRRSTSALEDSAAALALASSAGILQRLGGQFSPSSSTFETPDGPQSILFDYLHLPVQRSTSDSLLAMPDVLGSASSFSRISAESTDLSDGKFFFLVLVNLD